jgi:TRAP transporter TAXI family solute receptor
MHLSLSRQAPQTTRSSTAKKIGLAIAVGGLLSASAASADTFVRMVSGPSGGSWYPLGAKIMQVMDEEIDGITTSNTSGGGISNILSVNDGDAEIGFSYAHTAANGMNGTGKFSKPQKNVMHLATLYGSMFQVAVREDSPIKSFEDMKGANISPGKAKWTGTAFAEAILKEYGISFDSIRENGGTVHHVSYTESVALMKDGHIDVFMAATNMPQASFLELEQSPGIRFIGIDDPAKHQKILDDNPGFVPGVMPTGVYESITADTPTLGITVNMVVNSDLSEDLVYNMCKSLWANHAKFVEVKGIWERVKQEDALKGVAIPVHPGAQKCYDELGVTG